MDYQELLRRHDHPTRWEYPPDCDHRQAADRFARFLNDLDTALGAAQRSETGSHIQDASFHSQIYLSLPEGRFALIRFSNFGDMVTVSEDDPVPEQMWQLLHQLFTQHGYVYVPAAVLGTPYTGTNPGVTGIDTWWIRYFDWV